MACCSAGLRGQGGKWRLTGFLSSHGSCAGLCEQVRMGGGHSQDLASLDSSPETQKRSEPGVQRQNSQGSVLQARMLTPYCLLVSDQPVLHELPVILLAL